MKKIILLPIILGSALLVSGAVLLGIGIANSTKTLEREAKTYQDLGSFNNLNIKLSTADLEFYKADDDKAKVVADETSVDKYTVSVTNNTLSIEYKDLRQWYQRVFTWYVNHLKVKVYLQFYFI